MIAHFPRQFRGRSKGFKVARCFSTLAKAKHWCGHSYYEIKCGKLWERTPIHHFKCIEQTVPYSTINCSILAEIWWRFRLHCLSRGDCGHESHQIQKNQIFFSSTFFSFLIYI